MSKKSILLGAIASVIAINSVFADTIVTSKSYVDTTRQATIPVAGTNANTPGETVVTYTDTAGTIGERGILEPGQQFDMQTDANKLITLGQVADAILSVPNMMPETTVTTKTCYQEVNGDCILWNLSDRDVYGNYCTQTTDCPPCREGFHPYCYLNKCECIDNTIG